MYRTTNSIMVKESNSMLNNRKPQNVQRPEPPPDPPKRIAELEVTITTMKSSADEDRRIIIDQQKEIEELREFKRRTLPRLVDWLRDHTVDHHEYSWVKRTTEKEGM